MKIIELSKKQQEILSIIFKTKVSRSSAIYAELKKIEKISLVTVKRALSSMVNGGILLTVGAGRSIHYEITGAGKIFTNVDAETYCAVDPDKRYGASGYDFNFFSDFPSDIFLDKELKTLGDGTKIYQKRIKTLSVGARKKELERFIIELSWKSSKIEGNTYNLLDTEKLILEDKEALGHDKSEAKMIINHKKAFQFVYEHAKEFKSLKLSNLQKIHSILVEGLSVGSGLRKGLVGITGSKYKPLDNHYQIREAISVLSATISGVNVPYAKALLSLLGLSYIHPFEDGNKRTSRLMANAVLLAYDCPPLSYRSVDEREYRDAMIVFYELNSIIPFKKIFIEQYDFAAKNYGV